jgi:hypothetical protein
MNIKTAIENYLAVLASDEGKETDRIQKLILSLDELAMVSHTQLDYTFDEHDYPDPPERDYAAFRASVGKLFPSLGFYNVALDISDKIAQTSLAVGDAIDDIVDIAGDLNEVLWRLNNTSENDALFHFHLYFRSHWGRHLRNLQLCLHDFYW